MRRMLSLGVFLTLFIGTANAALFESGTKDAQPIVLYGKTDAGVIVPVNVDSDGIINTSGGIYSTNAWTDPITDHDAAGVIDTTTGTISSGTASLVVASASGWSVGMGIAVANAGTGGNTELITYITAINGTTFTLAANASATATGQTVNHDDTRALQAALDSGKNVHLRAGDYNVTSELTVDTALLFEGDGNRGRNVVNIETITTMGSVIINRGTTNNIFNITIGDTKFRNFSVLQNTGITPTAGYAFVWSSGTRILNVGMSYITVFGTFGGISVQNGVSMGFFNNLIVWTQGTTTAAALYINNDTPNGDIDWTDCDFRAYIGTPGRAIWIASADTQSFTNVKTNSSDPNLRIDDSGGAVINQRFTNCSFEAGSNSGPIIRISSTNALGVKNINFVGGEIGVGNSQDGVQILANAGQISFVGVLFHQLADGIQVDTTSGPVNITSPIFNSITGVPIRWTIGLNPVNIIGNQPNATSPLAALYTATSGVTHLRITNAVASGATAGAQIQMDSDDGAAVVNGDRLGSVVFNGSEDTSHTIANSAMIRAIATGTFSSTSAPSKLDFLTVPASSKTLTLGLTLDSSQNTIATGTITSTRTTDLGWSIVAGANTACNTTCTSACVMGWDTSSGEVGVACTDASADKCLCAGAS